MSYVPRSLFRLLEDMDSGNLMLPHIQRAFVWDEDQMIRLFDSLMRDYPIQTLLFWKTKEQIRARRFMIALEWDRDLSSLYDRARSAEGVEKTFVLDGQQRLQSLHTIFRGGILLDDGSLAEAYFDTTAGDVEVDGTDLRYKLVFSSKALALPMFRIRDLSERHAMTNALTLADDLNDDLESRLAEDADQRRQRERRVRANLQQLDSILRHDKYFWIEELDGVAKPYPYSRILDIFVRVNSGGTKLTQGDLMFAAMKEGWEDIEERIEQTVDLLNGTTLAFDKTFPLKCLLLAHGEGAEVHPNKFLGTHGEALLKRIEEHWDRAEETFQQLRDFIEQPLRVSSDKLVRSYNAFAPLFDFLFHNPKPDEGTRVRMAAYYHKAQLFNWFSRQTDAVLNSLHSMLGKQMVGGFPLDEIKQFFRASRGEEVEVQRAHLSENRIRSMLLNIVYADRWGTSPFGVAFKGNEPHVDHIYPQYMLRSKMGMGSTEINDIGNLRLFGATDNIRKRGELPDSYFGRLKKQGVPIDKHLLVPRYASDPQLLKFDPDSFREFRMARREEIWRSLKRTVDPEVADHEAVVGS
jgi:hypothetical protein